MKGAAFVKLSVLQRNTLEQATSRYAAAVGAAGDYLTLRGIPVEVANGFRLGVVAEPLPEDSDFAGRLAIPYLTGAGVVDIRFRALTPDQSPKYLSKPNAKTRMFNVPALLTDSPVVAVCEGEIDTMVMQALVGVPAVGIPGANNWKPHFRLLLEDFERVIVMCDGDQAGRDFGKKISGELDNAAVVHLPDGLDVNDGYLQHGSDWLRQRMGV